MPNTYTQIYIHCVFAVKYRTALIQAAWEEQLHKYITGIIHNNGHKLLAINSAADHIHLLISFNPKQSLAELMRLVKGDSSEFINKQRLTLGRFQWQEGYGAFSNSHSQLDAVVKYIVNQKQHHYKNTFEEEYNRLLQSYAIDYDNRYTFQALADG